ncbi:hypothetical protein D3C73_1383840 [compost metagenome]
MIRASGFDVHELLAVLQAGDAQALRDQVNGEIGWDVFLEYAKEEWLTVKTAVLHGYRYKFLTIGGLKDLLSIRFHKEEGRDYSFDGEEVDGLMLEQAELEALKGFLAVNWSFAGVVDESGSDGVVRVKIRHSRSNVLAG